MSKDYGLKVSQPGVDVKTARDDQLVFSSKFQTLHIFQQGAGSVTDSGGRTVTIAHNLGYPPKFLVHTTLDQSTFGNSSEFFISPFDISGGGISDLTEDHSVISWVDSTNLYIKFGEGFGWKEFHTGRNGNNYRYDGPFGSYTDAIVNGYRLAAPSGSFRSAIRFENVTLSQGASIYAAKMNFYLHSIYGGHDVKITTKGIKETNTSDFGGDPFGRSQTTASVNNQASHSMHAGDTWAYGVTSVVQEIINQGGWNSGNALGLFQFDNGTDNSEKNQIEDDIDGVGSVSFTHLSVLLSDTIANYKYTIFLDKIVP